AFAALAVFDPLTATGSNTVSPRDVGLLVTLWVTTALAYPWLHSSVGWFVDHVVLQRPDYAALRRKITAQLREHDDVAPLLDDIRLSREGWDRELREQEMSKLAAEAELRALRAQLNPHFLFNALTTIGYLIQTAPPRALETLMRLTALLRGVLKSEGELTSLG